MGNGVSVDGEAGYDELNQPVAIVEKKKGLSISTLDMPPDSENYVAASTGKYSTTGSKLGDDNEDDMSPLILLQQFIPYYGKGDPSNDSIVRAALSSMSFEDIDTQDEFGNTLLILACQYKCEDLVRIMLNKGADPNACNYAGVCGLHHACYRESFSMVIAKLLLQNGANPEVSEATYGCTPLHYCGKLIFLMYYELFKIAFEKK
jgi:ankyrin repeat protein